MGVGLTIGPFFGSGLYKITDFIVTFVLFGSLMFMFALGMYLFAPSVKSASEIDKFKNDNLEERGLLDSDNDDDDRNENQDHIENDDKFKLENQEPQALSHSEERKCGY